MVWIHFMPLLFTLFRPLSLLQDVKQLFIKLCLLFLHDTSQCLVKCYVHKENKVYVNRLFSNSWSIFLSNCTSN